MNLYSRLDWRGRKVTFHEIMENVKNGAKNWQQKEVLNYKQAIDLGVDKLKKEKAISTRFLKELHKILMSERSWGTTSNGGEFRKNSKLYWPW